MLLEDTAVRGDARQLIAASNIRSNSCRKSCWRSQLTITMSMISLVSLVKLREQARLAMDKSLLFPSTRRITFARVSWISLRLLFRSPARMPSHLYDFLTLLL